MEIWEKLSPAVRYAVIGGIVVTIGMAILYVVVASPSSDYAQTRGLVSQ